MLSSIIKQHQSHQQARNEEQEKNRKEAMLASNELTQGLPNNYNTNNNNLISEHYFSSSRSSKRWNCTIILKPKTSRLRG